MALRDTFDEDPELYDRARPGYPEALFDDLADLAGLRPGSRVVEIGCGTGQATLPLARRGYRVLAVELGAGLAEVARRRLAAFPGVEVRTSSFEAWPPPPQPFDLVLAATAFHWLDPAAATAKAASVLRPGGALAVVTTHHVRGGTERFAVDAQRCYERWDPTTPPDFRPPAAADVPIDTGSLMAGGHFGGAVVRRHEQERPYDVAEYLDLLRTYSNHRALEPAALDGLLTWIGRLIDEDHGGTIDKRWMNELAVAFRR